MQEELKEQGKALYVRLKENEADIRREMERVVPVFVTPDPAVDSCPGRSGRNFLEREMPPAEEVRPVLKQIIKEGRRPCPRARRGRGKASERVR